MKVKFNRWRTPNYLIGEIYNSFKPHVSDVDAQTLSEQCDAFREDIFKKAGIKDPNQGELNE